jgi:hypothetical protein
LKPRTTCAHSGRHTESKTRACATAGGGTRRAARAVARWLAAGVCEQGAGAGALSAHLAGLAHEHVVKRKLALRRVRPLDRRPNVDRARIGREPRKELGARGRALEARGRVALGRAESDAHAHAARLLLRPLALGPTADAAVRHGELAELEQAGRAGRPFSWTGI